MIITQRQPPPTSIQVELSSRISSLFSSTSCGTYLLTDPPGCGKTTGILNALDGTNPPYISTVGHVAGPRIEEQILSQRPDLAPFIGKFPRHDLCTCQSRLPVSLRHHQADCPYSIQRSIAQDSLIQIGTHQRWAYSPNHSGKPQRINNTSHAACVYD